MIVLDAITTREGHRNGAREGFWVWSVVGLCREIGGFLYGRSVGYSIFSGG